jgi:hypothetical protein
MTRKDYKAIADKLNSFWSELGPGSSLDQSFEYMLGELCRVFEADNPNFDTERFLQAVKFEG